MITFWNYFKKYWMSLEKFIKIWNINDYQGNKNLLKRTNNGLESYNKRLKSLFCSGTPSFADFVHTMKEESAYQQKKVQDYMEKSAVKKKKLMKMMVISSMICHHVMPVGCHHLRW